eukprot:3851071-Prorocentrum_lima.AAC.1
MPAIGYFPALRTLAPSVWGGLTNGRRLIARLRLDLLPAPLLFATSSFRQWGRLVFQRWKKLPA